MEINHTYQGNALEVLKTFPDNCIDMVLTSPPFKDEDVKGDYWKFYDKAFKEIMRVASKVVIIIHSPTKANELISRYPVKRLMIWNKGYSQMTVRFNIILAYQISEDYKINKYIYKDVFNHQSVLNKNKVHEYQDPEDMYAEIVSMFKGCQTILDPFCGSGTTAIAALRNEREYICIDNKKTNIANTSKRIINYQSQPKFLKYEQITI